MQKNIILLENIRSAYNVWNIIRTADSLWRDVWLSGYTPHPAEQPKVVKTSLGAEENVWLQRFDNAQEAMERARDLNFLIFAWELDEKAIALDQVFNKLKLNKNTQNKLIILWNEVDGVLNSTLEWVDEIVYIPMNWVKESMNVGQSAAIFMREMWK
jgi:tRNA G18 (ribose-2'-O)-methylase SpoU